MPIIIHVHGELGGNLEMKLSFLTLVCTVLNSMSFITEDNKQAVSLHSSDYTCALYHWICKRSITSVYENFDFNREDFKLAGYISIRKHISRITC